jgi:hypothetical protein
LDLDATSVLLQAKVRLPLSGFGVVSVFSEGLQNDSKSGPGFASIFLQVERIRRVESETEIRELVQLRSESLLAAVVPYSADRSLNLVPNVGGRVRIEEEAI